MTESHVTPPAYRLKEIYPDEVTSWWRPIDIAENMCNQLVPENRTLTAGEVVEIRNFFSGLIDAYGQLVMFGETE